MALYNIHKRATLDRVTLKFQLQARRVLKAELESLVPDVLASLNAGRRHFLPSVHTLRPKLENIFERHRTDTVRVAVSDGIQEISPGPDSKLGAWEAFPVGFPIEDSLSVALATARDRLIPEIEKKVRNYRMNKIRDLTQRQLNDYLESLRKVYNAMAADWQQGEDEASAGEVIAGLAQVLRSSDYSAERIFRTETTNYFNQGRLDYFRGNTAADYMQLYAVTDGRTSRICETRDGFVIEMSKAGMRKYLPAFHPHCRTIQRPLISALSSHMRLIEKGLAMNESSFAPLPKGWAA